MKRRAAITRLAWATGGLAVGPNLAFAKSPAFRLATFSADVTVPPGHGMMGGAWLSKSVADPLFAHGFAYFTSGHARFRPMRAIRLEAKGDITPADPGTTNAAIAWAHARQGNYMQTPIVVGDHVYGCLDNGVLTCFDARTGAIRYNERLGDGGEGFTASPVSDGRHLYFASELGNVFVVPVGEKFSVTATNRLGETCMATPAVSEGTLFFRTRTRVVAVGAKN